MSEVIRNTIQHASRKLTSGRLIIGVAITGIVGWLLIAGQQIPDALWTMWGSVVTFYFLRDRTHEN